MPQLNSAIIRKPNESIAEAINRADETAAHATKTIRAAKVSATEFVKAWMAMIADGHDLEWMAEETGLKVASICARASNYRTKKGIRLPKVEREAFGAKPLDIARLNNLIDSYVDDLPDSLK